MVKGRKGGIEVVVLMESDSMGSDGAASNDPGHGRAKQPPTFQHNKSPTTNHKTFMVREQTPS